MEVYNKLRHFELVDQIIPCIEHCGQKIMEIYEDFNIDIQTKEDNSVDGQVARYIALIRKQKQEILSGK